jgi:hypothetical protein
LEAFLLKLAKEIHRQFPDELKDICVVLPNRRASLFLKKYLAEVYKKTIWSPEIYATEDFIFKHSGYTAIDNLELLFQFYSVYKKIEQNEAKSFDEFSKWAPTLLTDFNEIDNYLADAEKLFASVNQVRALEIWNLDGKEPSPIQLQFIAFWEKLFHYYQNLKEQLHAQNMAYQGMAARYLAENIDHISNQLNYKKIFFAGFNALNKAEEKIIYYLLHHKKAEIFWDTDAYYMDNETQEAGVFLRHYKQKWFDNKGKNFNWIENFWRTSYKEIEIIGTSKNLNQVKAAGEILEKINSKNNYQDTAVVLADENLLMPLLNSIPNTVNDINVTMGMPLKYIPLYNLLEHILQMHEHATKHSNNNLKNYCFYHNDISKLLQNPMIKGIWKEKEAGYLLQKLDLYIKRKNRVYITYSELRNQCNNEELLFLNDLEPIFSNWKNNPLNAIEAIKSIIALFKNNLKNISNKKKQKIEAEYLYHFSKICNRIKRYIKSYDALIDVSTLKNLFNQIIRNESLAFYGEPLKGLQVMGVLETRTLDFDTVIITSTNESLIPAGKTMASLIPFDIKRAFGLPTYSEKDSIFAYHFYRLLQRAKNIYLIYNTEADDLGGGEKSRFISQIIQELPQQNNQIKLQQNILTLNVPKIDLKETKKVKNEVVIQQLNNWIEKGISPSALNSYISCPLDFYYKYVIKLRESDEDAVEETIEAHSLGNFIHNTLQEIYIPFLHKVVNENELESAKKLVPEILKNQFLENFSIEDINRGKNYLIYTIAEKQILKFIDREIEEIKKLKKENKHLQIIALEKAFETEVTFNCIGIEKKAKLTGRIDRIDKIGNTIRVIDYKTGTIKDSEVKLKNIDEIIMSKNSKSKALQLLIYTVLYQQSLQANDKLQTGIISFRNLKNPYIFLTVNNADTVSNDIILQTKNLISLLLEEIFNLEKPFVHNPLATYCTICT